MRNIFALMIGLVMTGGILLAQDHSNTSERQAKTQLTLASDTKVAGTLLKAGEYEVSCDKEKITFVRVSDHKKMLEVACKGTELSKKQSDTQTETDVDPSGVRVLRSLIIEGSNIKHTFS